MNCTVICNWIFANLFSKVPTLVMIIGPHLWIWLSPFAAAQFYADDMCILAPSIKGLQNLLNLCSSFCEEWDICLNSKKSKNVFFGKPVIINHQTTLSGSPIEWVLEWKYLGVVLRSGPRYGCSVSERVMGTRMYFKLIWLLYHERPRPCYSIKHKWRKERIISTKLIRPLVWW